MLCSKVLEQSVPQLREPVSAAYTKIRSSDSWAMEYYYALGLDTQCTSQLLKNKQRMLKSRFGTNQAIPYISALQKNSQGENYH
jgi:hypothetical protein